MPAAKWLRLNIDRAARGGVVVRVMTFLQHNSQSYPQKLWIQN